MRHLPLKITALATVAAIATAGAALASTSQSDPGMPGTSAQSYCMLSLAKNPLCDATVELLGAPFFVGGSGGPVVSPQTLVDGTFLPAGRRWDSGTVWWDGRDGLHREIRITIPEPRTIHSLVVQADNNDSYDISYWDAKQLAWTRLWTVPRVTQQGYTYGMQTRPNPADISQRHKLPEPVTTSSLRIVGGSEGDRLYSMSEVQAF